MEIVDSCFSYCSTSTSLDLANIIYCIRNILNQEKYVNVYVRALVPVPSLTAANSILLIEKSIEYKVITIYSTVELNKFQFEAREIIHQDWKLDIDLIVYKNTNHKKEKNVQLEDNESGSVNSLLLAL